MHAHTTACEKGETTTTTAAAAENASKVGTTLNPNNNGKEIAAENVKSGGKE
jgi:hypothetical protein